MRFSSARWLCVALTITLAVVATPGWSQSTSGSLTAVATDPTGAVIGDASVTVRHVETNITRTAQTNNDGRAYFPVAAVGAYEVTFEKTGFAKVTRSGVTVALNQNAVVTQDLKPAGTDEVVTVTEDAPLVNTTNSELGVRFDNDRLTDLPTSGMGALGGGFRDVYSFGLSAPGVSQINQGNTGFASGTDYAVNGARVRSNNFIVDGQDVNEPGVAGVATKWNNPEAVQEFQMITNQFSAEYGRNSGSVVNVVTKSGTNAFHGSAFWFHNSNPFNSLNNVDKAGGLTKAPLRIENQIGGSFGGPIVKSKTFFFGSLQKWSDRRLGSGSTITGAPTVAGQQLLQANGGNRPLVQALLTHLPAAGAQTGTVTYCFNPSQWNGPGAPPQFIAGPPADPSLACRFVSGTPPVPGPPVAGWSPLAVGVGRITGANRVTFDNWQWSGRVDHHLTSKHTLNARYLFNDELEEGGGQATPAGLANVIPLRTQAAVLGFTSALTERWLNEFRIGWNRFATSTGPQDPISLTIPSIEVADLGLNGFNAIGTRTAIGYGVNLPQSRINNIYQVTNNMGYNVGSHSLRWGVDYRRSNITSDFNPNVRGQLRFSTLTNLVADFANLTAQLNEFLPGGSPIIRYNWNDWAFFFQNDWKVTPRFTLNLGVRYELPGNSVDSIYEVNDAIVAANGGNELFRYTSRPPSDRNNVMPRFGFNWNPSFADKWVVRGGYTRAFDYAFLNMALNVTSAFPFQAAFSIPNTPNSFANLFSQTLSTAQLPCNALPAGVAVAKCLNQTRIFDEFRSPYADQYSFDVQREIGSNNVFKIGWVATKGTGLFQSREGNPVLTCPVGNCPRVDNFQGVIRVRANTGSSIYHSLQTSFDRRLAGGLNGGVHYTYSSFIDDASEVFNPSSAEVATLQNPLDPLKTGERARSTYDRPHRISGNVRYELPWMKKQNGFAGRIVGGWTIATLMTFQSGSPFTILNGDDPGQVLRGSLVGNAIRPNFAAGVDPIALRSMSIEEIRNIILATPPPPTAPPGTVGNIGAFFTQVTRANPVGNVPRNFLRGDGLASVDLSIVKDIRVREGHALQFRADAFNLPNHRNFGIPVALINQTAVAFLDEKATDGGNRRIFLALKYTF